MPEAERSLDDVIFGMEEVILRLDGLSRAVTIMGDRASSHDVDSTAVSIVGHVLEETVADLRAQWQRAFDLSHPGTSS